MPRHDRTCQSYIGFPMISGAVTCTHVTKRDAGLTLHTGEVIGSIPIAPTIFDSISGFPDPSVALHATARWLPRNSLRQHHLPNNKTGCDPRQIVAFSRLARGPVRRLNAGPMLLKQR